MSKSNSPLISVLTVVLNAEKTIEETIVSVVSQDFDDFEYIVIDGASTDNTIQIIEKYESKIAYWESEKDHGLYFAINKALNAARGKWIYVLGSDDVLLEGVLKKVATYLKATNAAYYGDVVMMSDLKKFGGKFSKFKTMYCNISHQSIFYPSDFYKVYRYDTYYPSAADYELLMRFIGSKRFELVYMPVTVALYNNLTGISSLRPDILFFNKKLNIVKKNYPFIYYLFYAFLFYIIRMLDFLGVKKNLKKVLGK